MINQWGHYIFTSPTGRCDRHFTQSSELSKGFLAFCRVASHAGVFRGAHLRAPLKTPVWEAICRVKAVPSFLMYFKTLSIGAALANLQTRHLPLHSQRSTDLVNPAEVLHDRPEWHQTQSHSDNSNKNNSREYCYILFFDYFTSLSAWFAVYLQSYTETLPVIFWLQIHYKINEVRTQM